MNEFQSVPYGMEQQYAPQGFFGGLLGAPLGGLIGKGIGGLLGNANMGRQIGQFAGGIGGSLLPFGADPVQQAQVQQQIQQEQLQQAALAQQLNPQGWLSNILGRPFASQIATTLPQQPSYGSIIGGGIAGNAGRMLPFGADPVQQAQLQQQIQMEQLQQSQQFAPQGWFGNLIGQVGRPLGGMIGGALGNAGLGSSIGGVAGSLGRMLPFSADPVQQAQLQQQIQLEQMQQMQQAQQFAPQGWFGNLIGQVGRSLGGMIGGALGNAGMGSTIGGVAGSLGRMLPFNADPASLAANPQAAQYAYQQLLQQVQQLQQQLAQQQQQFAQLAQASQQQGQQGQIAPQGWIGNLIGQVGQPLGGAIGGLFGNSGLGSSIGGVAGQIGRMLPFGADPVSQAYAQQAQLAQANSYYPQQGMQYQQPTLH